jgi:hypothetical protein
MKNSTYYNRKAAGLCTQCGAPATHGTVRCDACRAKHSKQTLASYHERREDGTCRYCENQAADDKHLCEECFEKARAYDNSRSSHRTNHRRQLRQDALDMYGRSCNWCGADDSNRLEFHHLDGSGHVERATRTGKNAGGHRLHERLRREGRDSNIVLLCMKCHAPTRKYAA